MSFASGRRRLLLDLTPMLDVIMILLFGVMIHSVERAKVDVEDYRAESEQLAERSEADREALLDAAQRNRELSQEVAALRTKAEQSTVRAGDLQEKLTEQRFSFSELLANLLQLEDPKKLTFRLPVVDDELKATVGANPGEVYKAIRRIEEMKKVFTFVDFHVDDQDFLTVGVDARTLERIPARGRSATEIENGLRQALEAVNFNQVVLILFSYESETLDRTVEATEAGVDRLLSHYRARWAGDGKQFRYGRVGLVEAPIRLDQG